MLNALAAAAGISKKKTALSDENQRDDALASNVQLAANDA